MCALAYACEWATLSILFVIHRRVWDKSPDWQHASYLRRIVLAYAVFEGSRGVVDGIIWLIAGVLLWREAIARGDDTLLNKHAARPFKGFRQTAQQIKEVSSELRYDVIRCASWGIVDSAPVSSPLNSSYDTFAVANSAPDSWSVSCPARSSSSHLRKVVAAETFVTTRRIHCPTALHSTTFDFRDFESDVFSRLRSLVGVDRVAYCHSFSIADGTTRAMVERFTEGKSGSFFYFTQDSRYIVKTVTNGEAALLHASVHAYSRYLEENPDSFLTRFLGLHAMRLSPEQAYITLVVMENLFPAEERLKPKEKYDLKGSWVGRSALKKGSTQNKENGKGLTLKDKDIVRKFSIGPERKEKLMKQLTRDVDFLVQLGIMDYR